MDKYSEQIHALEIKELELPLSDVDLYTKLMAYYLVENKLFDAKFLWIRIPQNMKTENVELQRLNELQKSIVSNNFSDVFKTISETEWSDDIKNVMGDLRVITMENIFQLIGKAYTSIMNTTLIELTNLPKEQLEQKYVELGWTFERNAEQFIVRPKKPTCLANVKADSEYQLSKLTEFVSFLEN